MANDLHNRATTEPGGCECVECGAIFIGGPAHETCAACTPDEYGNTERVPFLNCSFPDCGCDGSRLCMAKNGPSGCANSLNFERGTWNAS